MTELEKKYFPTKLAGYVGFTVQAIVNNFLPILFIVFQDIYGLGYEKLGRLIVFNFATQMVIDFLTPKILHKIGYRRAAVCLPPSARRLPRDGEKRCRPHPHAAQPLHRQL